jgi:D-3-phosphoglycerate dehydrogenase / 2-oxoglutarate reductase
MEKVLITTSSFGKYSDKPIELLKKHGFEPILNPYGRKLTKEETLELYKDIKYVIAGTEKIDQEVMDKSPRLKVISRCGVSMDNVDLEQAKKRQIIVTNTPYGPTQSVAELTIGLMLDLLRNITLMDREMRKHIWKKRMGFLLGGKTVGIIGLGKIGKQIVEYLKPFGVKVLAYDKYQDNDFADKYNVEYKSLEDLLKSSDVVSINVSLNPETHNLINMKTLSMMKKESFLINLARGEVINEDDLYQALMEEKISGAAIDTFTKEPYQGKLLELDNTVITPHIGSYAREGRIKQEYDSAENLIDMVKGV